MISRKRSRTEMVSTDVNTNFLSKCEKEFNDDPSNIISRNAIVSVGSILATTNSSRLNNIDHIFMNSIKKKDVKATDQGQSGRCWLFASLNTFRHSIIKTLKLDNFEFSETYLFFYDKLERSNTYLRWFIDTDNIDINSREFYYITRDHMGDGGWWTTFTNLVKKYGLLPKNAMKETYQSSCSSDMNSILEEILQTCSYYITTNKNRLSKEELLSIKEDTMKQVYNTLVKFLGEPPKKFQWSYTNEEGVPNIIEN